MRIGLLGRTGVKRLLLHQETLNGRKKHRGQELYDTRSGLDEEQAVCLFITDGGIVLMYCTVGRVCIYIL